jgi:ligand-binding sensor domain-containing protein
LYESSGFRYWDQLLKLILLAGQFGISLISYSQQAQEFDRLVRSDGLSQSSVNCMIRDHEGFMWFGTQDGLNRYDGKNFRVFQNQPGDAASLSNNYIVSICEDEEGFLWIGTMTGGLNRFDKHTETFHIFQHCDTLNSISGNTVWTVISDGKGNIWSGTSLGLNRYNKSSGKFTCYRHDARDPGSLVTDMVVSLLKDHSGNIWVGTVEGLCKINFSTGKFTSFINPDEGQMPGSNLIWSVSESPDENIISGTNNGIYSLNPSTKVFTRILGEPDTTPVVAWSIEARHPGIIWAGSNHGLYRIHTTGNQYEVYLNDPVNSKSIADNNIWCLLHDPGGLLWAGTNGGISKTKTSKAVFRLINAERSRPLSLSSPKVTAILEDKKGNLWVGTDGGGLNCIDPARKKNTVYSTSNSGLQNDNVWALAEDPVGNIWIGNYQGGLHVINPTSRTIRAFPNKQGDSHALSNNRILTLLAGKDGMVWIGTRGGGLIRFNPGTGEFKTYQHLQGDSTSISGNTILSLAFDKNDRLWAGTYEAGLNLFNPLVGKFISFKKEPENPSSLSDNNVWAILFDKNGRLWLGTQGGLNYSENPGEKMSFRYFSTRDGLKSNTIFGLEEDAGGNIWMSNFNGLTRLDIKTFETSGKSDTENNDFSPFRPLFRMFDSDHGLQGPEFNQGAYHKGHSGLLYFGGPNGLNYFSSEDVKESTYMPPVVITSMKIFNKEVSISPGPIYDNQARVRIIRQSDNYFLPEIISNIKELILTYRESVISFEFASLDYTNPRKNQYAYKMINFDSDWNYVGNQNNATYTNLDAGEYTLLIRGSNADGTWNPVDTVLKIIIKPPFWKTIWFIISCAIIFLLIIFFIVRSIFLNQRRKAQKEKEFIELQLKTIKSQIDPHFAFNALNTIASFIYSEEPDVTYDYFTRFARMIRNILEDHEKISRSLAEEMDFVKNYLELQKIRFKDKFDYLINIDDDIPPETQVPKMIIQTYTENAIKHGLMHRMKDGHLKITVEKEDSCLQFIIEDNGVGRLKASELNPNSTHRGLKIMEQIIELYRKLYHTAINQRIEDLADEKGNPSGTKVILTICMLNQPGKKHGIFNLRNKKSDYDKR